MGKSIVFGFVLILGASALGCRQGDLVVPMRSPVAGTPRHEPTQTATSSADTRLDADGEETAGRGRTDKFLWDSPDTNATR